MGFQPSAWGHCDFQASWPWVRNLQAQGTSFPIVHKSQWWFHSFSLKYMNTMTVIVKKTTWTKLLLTNHHRVTRKISLQYIGKINKLNMDIQTEVSSAKACSMATVGLWSGSVIARMICSVSHNNEITMSLAEIALWKSFLRLVGGIKSPFTAFHGKKNKVKQHRVWNFF